MNLAHDLAVLKKMADELPDYLAANVPFWQMQAPSTFPKLSLGMLLLTRARLQAADVHLDQEQRAERNTIERTLETTFSARQVAAETKAAQELRTRANLWQRYWDDCRDEPRSCADHYPHEVTQRVIAELLLREFPRIDDTTEARTVAALDTLVRARLQGDQFVWPPELEPGFPAAQFWFLYGLPHHSRQA